jgi:Icc-related predicted phosphoesterase
VGLFSKRDRGNGSGEETRLFFATDLHGSEICFRKLLSAPRVYSAETIIMGGDCTGKMLIPIVATGGGDWESSWAGETMHTSDEEELGEYETRIKNTGCYPARVTLDEAARLDSDPEAIGDLFTKVMNDTLAGWVALAEQRFADTGVHVIMTPGNDDDFSVDDVLKASEFIDAAEGGITRIGRHELLSLGWANETPWDTPRECSEEELAGKIKALADQIEDMENAIFNIHVPPYGTGLDEAPELDDQMTPRAGIMASVGSTAVRDAILEYQPLLSLHGHIHESKGVQQLGRTMAINPGSVYGDWSLQGVVVDLADRQVSRYTLTTG